MFMDCALDKKFWLNFNTFLIDNIIKLFADQSEVSALPAGCSQNSMYLVPSNWPVQSDPWAFEMIMFASVVCESESVQVSVPLCLNGKSLDCRARDCLIESFSVAHPGFLLGAHHTYILPIYSKNPMTLRKNIVHGRGGALRSATTLDCNQLFAARKRSLGQDNIFTPVCHSVHGGGGGCLLPGGCLVWRCLLGGGGGVCLLLGGAWWRPSGQLLLREVHILLECILVVTKFTKYHSEQECIPVGCVPSAGVAVSGGGGVTHGGLPRGCLPGGICPGGSA